MMPPINISKHFKRACTWTFWVGFYGILPSLIELFMKSVLNIELEKPNTDNTIVLIAAKELQRFSIMNYFPNDFVYTCISFLTGSILVDLDDIDEEVNQTNNFTRFYKFAFNFYYSTIIIIILTKLSKSINYYYYDIISFIMLFFALILVIFTKYLIYKINSQTNNQ